MCYKASDGWKALLNDFDLALRIGDRESRIATSKHRTGTAPYMARELLDSAPLGVIVTHEYAHELESLFYLLLFIALGYTKSIPEGDPLKHWRSRDWMRIAEAKDLFFSNPQRMTRLLSQVRIRVVFYWPY